MVSGVQQQVPLPSVMQNSNIVYLPTNSIKVVLTGIYELNFYFVNSDVSASSIITTSLRLNGTNIQSTTISRYISTGSNSLFSVSTIVSLNSDDIIDMAISSNTDVNITLSSSLNASLSLKKIN